MTTTSSASVSVIIASAQSVAKVYVIGAVGYLAVKFPRKAPLLPATAVSTVARFAFHVLVIPLIYSTIANSVTPTTIGNFWIVIVAAFGVLGISFVTATILAIPFNLDKRDFCTLRISATFPNIVALPILIFPSLCEYGVVYNAFGGQNEEQQGGDGNDQDRADLYASCVESANTMIFIYFLAWSLLFWSLGYRNLMAVAISRNESLSPMNNGSSSLPCRKAIVRGIRQTCLSPGFVAMLLGFITACIPPLQQALFDQGGYLRFLGAALQTLGVASSSISTMVVAASLVPPRQPQLHDSTDEEDSSHTAADTTLAVDECHEDTEETPANETKENDETRAEITCNDAEEVSVHSSSSVPDEEGAAMCRQRPSRQDEQDERSSVNDDDDIPYESPIMSDPNFGPHQFRRRSSIARFRQSIRRHSQRVLTTMTTTQRPTRSKCEMRKLLLWFTLSRLVVTPGIVVSVIVALDYANLWVGPDLAKLVIIINAALPGALIVVVLLKSKPELSDTASVVAKVYLPSYLLSIVTIAAWTALGLWIALPPETNE